MKALVLFSGGLDSSVCLGMAVKKYGADEVLALSVSYGQKHFKELEAAKKVAAHYGVETIHLDLGAIFEGSDCTLLQNAHGDVPWKSTRTSSKSPPESRSAPTFPSETASFCPPRRPSP